MNYIKSIEHEKNWSHLNDEEKKQYDEILNSDISILRIYASLFGIKNIKVRAFHTFYGKSPLVGVYSNEGYTLRLDDGKKTFYCYKKNCGGTVVKFIMHVLKLNQIDAINILHSYVTKSTSNLSEKGIIHYNKIFENYDSEEVKRLIDESEEKEADFKEKIASNLKRHGISEVAITKAARKFCCSKTRVIEVAKGLGKIKVSEEESKMKICYSDQEVLKGEKSIFLAGPTPREEGKVSWRKYACEKLRKMGFDGIVYVPEYSTHEAKEDYVAQAEWEREALSNSSAILFWVPSKLPGMEGFTTRVEFGYWMHTGRIIYGRPAEAAKIKYLDWLYDVDMKKEPYTKLKDLLAEAVVKASEVGVVEENQVLPIQYRKVMRNNENNNE